MPSGNKTSGPVGGRPLLRRLDQAVVAVLVAGALVGMAVYWVVQGGPRGELIEIDRAEPLSARYLVDINKAEWFELAELPEVGETLARRIIELANDARTIQRQQRSAPRTRHRPAHARKNDALLVAASGSARCGGRGECERTRTVI